MEGTIIGQYRVVQQIGAGGMGVVYVAEHVLVGRRAALKVLLPEYSVRRALVTRFFNEARAMTSIPDPGIVQMYDFGFHSDGSAYIVMELLEGETLERRLQRLHRLPLLDALRITRQLAGSLAAAHAAGVIHRDLKPENIFMVRDPEALGGERPKVLDFGVAKLSGDVEHGQTLAGSIVGAPAYMSPEQCRAGTVDARSDIYALGCVVTRLVTGRLPFDGSMGELISAHLNASPARPGEVTPGLPPELDDIVLRCLAKSPGDRFQTMVELQSACDALLARLSMGGGASALGALAGARSGAGSVIPEGASLPFAAPAHPTTLSSAAGVTHPSASGRTRRLGVWIGIGAVSIGAGIAAAIALAGGDVRALDRGSAAVAAPAPSPVATDAVAPRPDPPAPDAGIDDTLRAGAPPDATPAPAPAAQPPAQPPAPASKSRPRPKPHRPAPERPEELYDDR
jgi:hypothetical protein